MTDNSQDTLARAYATLLSLRKNIDQMTSNVRETYVHEFHALLTKLEESGINVSEFRIPNSEINPTLVSLNTFTGEKRYTDEKYVDKRYFLIKLDAILGYFEIITSEKPRNIGFRTPNQ